MLNAKQIKAANGLLTIFWLLNLPPFVWLYFALDTDTFIKFSLLYLGVVSIWANVASHFTGWVAGRVDVKIEEEGVEVMVDG